MSKSVISIPLGICTDDDQGKIHLEHVASRIALAQNRCLQHWLVQAWMRLRREQEVAPENWRQAIESSSWLDWCDPKSLYHEARTVCPDISSKAVSAAVRHVTSDLADNMPYTHEGQQKRWRAVLLAECNPSTYRAVQFPIQKQDTRWIANEDSPAIDTILYSKEHRGARRRRFALHVGKLSASHRAIFWSVAKGERKWSDSMLLLKDGKWYFQLVYHSNDAEPVQGDGTAVLMLGHPYGPRPFVIECESRTWKLGRCDLLLHRHARSVATRKAIQLRYRDAARYGRYGRGRRSAFKSIKGLSRGARDEVDRLVKSISAEVRKFCVRNDCPEVVYREPSLPLRQYTWFSVRGIPWPWTRFDGWVKQQAEKAGITRSIERESIAAYRERLGLDALPKAARVPETSTWTGIYGISFEQAKGEPGHERAPLATGIARRGADDGYNGGGSAVG